MSSAAQLLQTVYPSELLGTDLLMKDALKASYSAHTCTIEEGKFPTLMKDVGLMYLVGHYHSRTFGVFIDLNNIDSLSFTTEVWYS